MWMCAAVAGPDSFENVSFHVSTAPFEFSTYVPENDPPAPAGAPFGAGTSLLALSVELTLYDSPAVPASAIPALTAKPAHATASIGSFFTISSLRRELISSVREVGQ